MALALFILYERKHPAPLIRLDFFKRPGFAAANIANFLVGAALIIGMVEIPLYAYTLFGMTEIERACSSSSPTILIPVGAVVGGWLADLDRLPDHRRCWVPGRCGGYLLVCRWPLDPAFWIRLATWSSAASGSVWS